LAPSLPQPPFYFELEYNFGAALESTGVPSSADLIALKVAFAEVWRRRRTLPSQLLQTSNIYLRFSSAPSYRTFSDDQCWRKHRGLRRCYFLLIVLLRDHPVEFVNRDERAFMPRLAYRRQRWPEKGGFREIIKANHRNVTWHALAKPVKDLERAKCHLVIGDKHCVKRRELVEQTRKRLRAALG
jgi:hypothetical protein